jgi:hypothetical protein
MLLKKFIIHFPYGNGEILALLEKNTIFKTMALSKIVYVSFLSSIPSTITNKVIELQDDFIWDGKRSSKNITP